MKKTRCDYCGEDLGGSVESYGEPVSCGERDCVQHEREDARGEYEERMLRAERDGYERY